MSEKSKLEVEIYEFFHKLDRSFFVDPEFKDLASRDHPLPIGFDQTISQPTLVLYMTMSLDLHPDCRVLEIGTGSGYQTAFLAEFASQVYTVERIPELAEKAKNRLLALGYNNISFHSGDGSLGWEEYAPYDRIMVTAAAAKIPDKLIQQLNPGGKMIIPIGPSNNQELFMLLKKENHQIEKTSLGDVRFVEFKGEYGWK
ncbi:protein-l-isoaspartate o-methyltransferase [hydrocarbon metagenome]|uniref:protein-L-isoaspartate(D-aspartate) O-methyltransferase n=1 Tax=hydrocarbon metagenome TaxID=938273 RepID=A0A0W8E1J6_9ZZZZ